MVWYDMIAVWHQVKVTAHWKGSHLAHRWFDSAPPMNKVDKREKKKRLHSQAFFHCLSLLQSMYMMMSIEH